MSARGTILKTAECCGVFVLVVAALPLIAILGFVARGLMMLLVLGGAVGVVVLYGVNPGLRNRVGRALGVLPPVPTDLRPVAGRRS